MQQVVIMTVGLVVVAGVFGFVLGYLISGMFEAETDDETQVGATRPTAPTAPAKPKAPPAKAAPVRVAAKKDAPAVPAKMAVKKTAPAKVAVKKTAPAKVAVKKTAPAKVAVEKTAPVKVAVEKTAPVKVAAKKPAPTPLRGPMAVRAEEASKIQKSKSMPPAKKSAKAAASAKPRLLKQARGGKPDNLKRIGGVGPKLEGLLNDLGIFHYDQIAKLTAAQIAWVDDKLSFKGRIAREDWVDQATKLAAGETTDFAGRVDKGKVSSSKAPAKRRKAPRS